MGIKTTKIYVTEKKNWKDRNSDAVFSVTGIYKFANRLEYSNYLYVGMCRDTRHFSCQEFMNGNVILMCGHTVSPYLLTRQIIL